MVRFESVGGDIRLTGSGKDGEDLIAAFEQHRPLGTSSTRGPLTASTYIFFSSLMPAALAASSLSIFAMWDDLADDGVDGESIFSWVWAALDRIEGERLLAAS